VLPFLRGRIPAPIQVRHCFRCYFLGASATSGVASYPEGLISSFRAPESGAAASVLHLNYRFCDVVVQLSKFIRWWIVLMLVLHHPGPIDKDYSGEGIYGHGWLLALSTVEALNSSTTCTRYTVVTRWTSVPNTFLVKKLLSEHTDRHTDSHTEPTVLPRALKWSLTNRCTNKEVYLPSDRSDETYVGRVGTAN